VRSRNLFFIALGVCFIVFGVTGSLNQQEPLGFEAAVAAPHKMEVAVAAEPAPKQSTKDKEDVCDRSSGEPCIAVAAIVGPIGGNMDDAIANFVIRAENDKADALVFLISSPGGDFNKSEKIFNAIKGSKVPTYCYASEMAASGAFWILQACDNRAADPQARLMTHSPMVVIPPNKTILKKADLTSALAEIEMLNEIQAYAISTRIGMKPEYFKEILSNGDWWMSPQSAKRVGALDVIAKIDKYLSAISDKLKK